MDIPRIKQLILEKSGVSPIEHTSHDLEPLSDLAIHPDIQEYLRHCLPIEKYVASKVVLLPLDDILGWMGEATAPGTYIRPFGYLITAYSVGGNVVCFHNDSGKVFWCDRESFSDQWITYKNRVTGDWKTITEYTPENVQRAMVPLSDRIEDFLDALLRDGLGRQLAALDLE